MLDARDDQIIKALRARIQAGRYRGMGWSAGPQLAPPSPCTRTELNLSEAVLGFPLPTLLRRIYTEVANGGVGPNFGMWGIDGGWESDFGTAVDLFRILVGPTSDGSWPDKTYPVWDLGGGEFEAIDCDDPELILVRWNQGDEQTLAAHLERTSRGFRGRLESWLEATAL